MHSTIHFSLLGKVHIVYKCGTQYILGMPQASLSFHFLPAAKRHGHAELFRCSCSCSWQDVWLKRGNFCFLVQGSFIICLFRLPWQILSIFALISIHFYYQPQSGMVMQKCRSKKKKEMYFDKISEL